jgi:putative photosynthetic complex assembly protein
MSAPAHPAQFPRAALIGAAALICFSLVTAAVGRLSGAGVSHVPEANPVRSIELRFEDRPDGAVAVYEAGQGRTVAVLPPGTNGFVRGVMRGMARERRQHDVGMQAPFRVTSWDNGALSLEDPTTGRRIELEAFGPTNFEVFARLLTDGSASS